MAEPRRILRLQQLMLEALATALQQQVEDPRVEGVTITRVKLAKDLTTGIVYWSSLEPGGPRRTAERGLADALPYLQALVAEALGTRQTPRLTLHFDESIERASHLEEIFAKLARERGDLPAPGEGVAEADDDVDDDGDDDGDPSEDAAADADAGAAEGQADDDDEPEDDEA
jgi:ribosome-binding factor A